MTRVCLIVVFNHKYIKNITKLRKTYKGKFSDVFYLVPFFDNSDHIKINNKTDDIIPVYESSYNFQGYFAQAFQRIKQDKYDSFVFVADDMIINPSINENNIFDYIGIETDDSYIKQIEPFGHSGGSNSNRLYSVLHPFCANSGVTYKSEIINYEEACKKCINNSLIIDKHIGFKYFRLNYKGFLKPQNFLLFISILIKNKGLRLRYPLYSGYSDFIIISKSSIESFVKNCGVFSAMNIFVETAVPTAMAISCNGIKTEKDIKLRGIEYWGKDIERFEKKYEYSISKLNKSFGHNILYYHPVKLSKWKND